MHGIKKILRGSRPKIREGWIGLETSSLANCRRSVKRKRSRTTFSRKGEGGRSTSRKMKAEKGLKKGGPQCYVNTIYTRPSKRRELPLAALRQVYNYEGSKHPPLGHMYLDNSRQLHLCLFFRCRFFLLLFLFHFILFFFLPHIHFSDARLLQLTRIMCMPR
jgi:hypothetical protein